MAIEAMPWNAVLLVAGTLLAVGRLLDYMYGWLWSDRLSKALAARASKHLDRYFIELLHSDLRVAAAQLDRVFGDGRISKRYLLGTTIILTAYGVAGLIIESISHDIPIIASAFVSLMLMAIFVGFSNVVSLLATRMLLSASQPRIRRLTLVVVVDLVVAYLLMGLPWWLGSMYMFPIQLLPAILMTTYYVFVWPIAIYHGFVGHGDYSFQAWFNIFGVVLMCLGAALPSLFHIRLLCRDLLRWGIIRWIDLGLAGLFSQLSTSKQPVTVVCTGLALLLPLIKVLSDG